MPLKPRAKFEITAEDKTAAVLRKSSQRFQRFATKTSTILAAAFSGAGLGLLAREITDRTRIAEQAMAQLSAAIESTGGVAGFTSDQLAGMAADLQKLTTFGDEAIISMQSVLLTFTRIRGPEFERTQQAILNVATRMGTTLQGAAVQLGKALNDPIANLGELGRAGIQFSKDQKDAIKALVETGDIAKAQGIILDELETQFGGAAAAAKDTFGGALEGLKNAFGDLLEGDGGSLQQATDGLNELTDILQDPNTVAAFASITSAIITMTGALASATTWFANMSKEAGESLARAFGAGTPIDEAAERIESLQRAIESIRASGPFSKFSGTDFLVKKYEAEIAELQEMVQLNDELAAGKEKAAAVAESSREAVEAINEIDISGTVAALEAEYQAHLKNNEALRRKREIQQQIAQEARNRAIEAQEAIRRQENAPDFVGPRRDSSTLNFPERVDRVPASAEFVGPSPTTEQRAAANEFQKNVREGLGENADFAREMYTTMQDASADFFASTIRGFQDLKSAGRFALGSIIEVLVDSLTQNVAGGFANLLPGFQHGGQFRVGGVGGPDSQLVAFRATPGERVTVTPPGQRGSSGVVIHNHTTIEAGVTSQELAAAMPAMEDRIRSSTINAIADLKIKGRW